MKITKATRRHREHTGAKNGGGFWGRRVEAKTVSKKSRRARDRARIDEAL
jgi:hypothetical protein